MSIKKIKSEIELYHEILKQDYDAPEDNKMSVRRHCRVVGYVQGLEVALKHIEG